MVILFAPLGPETVPDLKEIWDGECWISLLCTIFIWNYPFVLYRPDPKWIAVNVFLLDWSKLDFYAFPPFVCLNRVLQKLYQDKAKGIVTAPDWPSQPFYPRLITMSVKTISIAPRETNLSLPSQPAVKHPKGKTLKILACLVNGTKVI